MTFALSVSLDYREHDHHQSIAHSDHDHSATVLSSGCPEHGEHDSHANECTHHTADIHNLIQISNLIILQASPLSLVNSVWNYKNGYTPPELTDTILPPIYA